jgi:hypothetical protein
MPSESSALAFLPGDLVLWRLNGDKYTVDRVQADAPRPIWLRKKICGITEIVRVSPSELLKLPLP